MNIMKMLYYKTLAYLFYYIGDIAWRVPNDFFFTVYGKAMRKSFEYDDLSGGTIWKEPEEYNY